ncbi:MAG: hypothetical protein ACXIUZ_04385 [Lysobacteraceae bacterium]
MAWIIGLILLVGAAIGFFKVTAFALRLLLGLVALAGLLLIIIPIAVLT